MTTEHNERADATVFYLAHDRDEDFLAAIAELGLDLLPEVPLFTRRLGPGIGVAPDPSGPLSFGEVCCLRAAERLVNGLKRRHSSSPSTPLGRRSIIPRGAETHEVDAQAARNHLLAVARCLRDTAVRADDRAGWLVSTPTSPEKSVSTGPDVYGGTPGPVLLLAHAVAITGDTDYRELLQAAARDAVARLDESSGFGFHAGAAGTAVVLAEASLVASDPTLADVARIARRHAERHWLDSSRSWDLLHGHAGFALAMIIGSRLLGEVVPSVVIAALDRLVSMQTPSGPGWRTAVTPRRRIALTGLAHGASGAALALTAGRDEFQTDRWNAAIDNAITFERRWRMPSTGGWLDRRYAARHEAIAWCHGAAGIGLAAAALAAAGEPTADMATVAAARLISTSADHGRAGCLCHGPIGNLLALREMGVRSEREDWSAFALSRSSTTRFRQPTERIAFPSLMLGETGIAIGWYVLTEGLPAPRALTLDWRVDGSPRSERPM